MFEGVPCIECGGLLIFDADVTSVLYSARTVYEFEDIETVVKESINKKLCFICKSCGKKEDLDYQEWENRVRTYLTMKLLNDRAFLLLSKFRREGVDEVNGITYCGGCFGYGGDGWCLNDIINQCELGKINTNEL